MKKIVVTLISVLSLAFMLNGCGGGSDGSASEGGSNLAGGSSDTGGDDAGSSDNTQVYSSSMNKPDKIEGLTEQVPMVPDE